MDADSGVEWRAWPLGKSPVRGALAAIIVVGSVAGVWSWSANVFLTALAVGVLGISVGPFFLPTGYRLDPLGVEVRLPWRRRRRPWSDFRTVYAGGELVVLSPFGRRTWLETLRGETLRTEGNRGEVYEYAKRMVESAAGQADA